MQCSGGMSLGTGEFECVESSETVTPVVKETLDGVQAVLSASS